VHNEIDNAGYVYTNASGIWLKFTAGNLVAHNWIHDLPYLGVRLDGCTIGEWDPSFSPDLPGPYTVTNIKPYIPTVNNIIKDNHLKKIGTVLADSGAIYLWGVMGQGTNAVNHNWVEDVGRPGGMYVGIYLDDQTDGVQVTHNLIERAAYGMHIHGAPNDVIENNIVSSSTDVDLSVQPEDYCIAPMSTVVRHNVFYRGKGILILQNGDWSKQPLGQLDYNIYWREGTKMSLGLGAGFDQHSLNADPRFTDPVEHDFTFGVGSPAAGLGIAPIAAFPPF
jgi:hypothetical protein